MEGLSDADLKNAESAFETALMLGKVAAIRTAFATLTTPPAQKLLDQAHPYVQRMLDIDPAKTDHRKMVHGNEGPPRQHALGVGRSRRRRNPRRRVGQLGLLTAAGCVRWPAQQFAGCAKLATKEVSRAEADRTTLSRNYAGSGE